MVIYLKTAIVFFNRILIRNINILVLPQVVPSGLAVCLLHAYLVRGSWPCLPVHGATKLSFWMLFLLFCFVSWEGMIQCCLMTRTSGLSVHWLCAWLVLGSHLVCQCMEPLSGHPWYIFSVALWPVRVWLTIVSVTGFGGQLKYLAFSDTYW